MFLYEDSIVTLRNFPMFAFILTRFVSSIHSILSWCMKEILLILPSLRFIAAQAKGIDKGKVVPVHTMKAYRGRRGIGPLILNLSTRWKWVANFTSRKEPQ